MMKVRVFGLFKATELEDLDIEFDIGIDIKKNVELEVEKEAKRDIFEETNKTKDDLDRLLGKAKDENIKKSRIIKDVNEIDFKNMTTLIIETGKIAEKGIGTNEIKISKSLVTEMNEFFGLDGDKNIQLEILDNKDNKEYIENDVNMLENGKGISIRCEKLGKLMLKENDLLRIIKINDEKFRIEIIREDTAEYNIWERYCIYNIKGSKRRFGIIQERPRGTDQGG